MKLTFCLVIFSCFLLAIPAEVTAVTAQGENALNGGFGFQAGLSDWTPGGFKWFNGYSRQLTQRGWLNFQVNVVAGDMDDRHCWNDVDGDIHCDNGGWDGNTVEFVAGVKLRWDMGRLPIIIDAKLGGAFELLFLGNDYVGFGVGFRAGIGVHYFFFPDFGIGAELVSTIGPSFIPDGPGAELYAAIDFQAIGVEYRF
ncbi:MAG: hypothetical protein QNJ97_01725 [Myxococcota bacterium]|nr:hypothetical protein [Myxococcota bacterium]